MMAIILAAGRGSRMQGLTDDRPKCLVEINGKSLLQMQLEAIRNAGISQIALVTGYRRKMLKSDQLVEFHNDRWFETNMVSSLACADEWLESGPCIVSYSDIFYKPEAVRKLIDCVDDLAVTYDPNWLQLWRQRFVDPLSDAETFRISTDSTLLEIGEKPISVEEVEGQYMGLLRFTPAGWAEIKRLRSALPLEAQDRMHMTGTLQLVIEAGNVPVRAIAYTGGWGEIDNASDLISFKEF
jgi:choline kinase